MKRTVKAIILWVIALLNIVVNTGCWNYRELNDIAIVAGVAVDRDKKDNKYVVTFEIVNTKGAKGGKNLSDIVTIEGNSIFDATRNAIEKLGRKLYWSHAKIVVIDKSIAKEGITPVLDFIYRDAEIRTDIWLLISNDETAADILKGKDNYHDTISYHADEALRNEASVSKYEAVELWRFANELSGKGISAVIPTAKMVVKEDERVPMMVGTAVFRKDKMVGSLDLIETRNVLLAKDKYKKGVIPIPDVTDKVSEVSLEVLSSKTKLNPVLKDELPGIIADIEIDVDIGEIMGSENLIEEKGRQKVKEKAQKVIKKQVEDVIRKVQTEYKSDIFGFGSVVQREMPDLWKKIEPEWQDIFSRINTEVNVKVNIKGSALSSKSIKIGD